MLDLRIHLEQLLSWPAYVNGSNVDGVPSGNNDDAFYEETSDELDNLIAEKTDTIDGLLDGVEVFESFLQYSTTLLSIIPQMTETISTTLLPISDPRFCNNCGSD